MRLPEVDSGGPDVETSGERVTAAATRATLREVVELLDRLQPEAECLARQIEHELTSGATPQRRRGRQQRARTTPDPPRTRAR
jgi:hypothetical protein